jgi:alpha-L-fucosidase
MQSCLRSVGAWLKVKGEAIYGSRYWNVFRDGDVRFTRKGNILYAIALEWPEETLRLTSLAGTQVTNVQMLGSSEPVTWKQEKGALNIQPPSKRPCRYAYTFRITCSKL